MFLSKWVICMFQGVFEKEHHLPNLHFSASNGLVVRDSELKKKPKTASLARNASWS